jgi:hypothetical protein
MSEFLSYGLRILGSVARWIPRFLRSILFPISTVREQIRIELCSLTKLGDQLPQNPYVDMYFEITNLSHLTVTMERLFIDVSYGQPLFNAWTLRRYEVPAGGINKDIYHKQYLTGPQKEMLQLYAGQRLTLVIDLIAYFESKIGMIEVTKKIVRYDQG